MVSEHFHVFKSVTYCSLYLVFLETQLHTTELQDGYDWGRLNLQSITEQSQLDEFLATAELAGTEFTVNTCLPLPVTEMQTP